MFTKYFSFDYLLAKNALWNVAFSDRSDGKTFDIKYHILKNFRDHGFAGVYIRRYKTEIQTDLLDKFFDEVTEKKKGFEGWIFKHSKNKIECSTDDGKTFKIICYIIPLTMSGKLKSTLYINDIHYMYYDEFIPLDGKYINNEINILLEFWKSIDRDRDTTILMIAGNKVTPFNPLFDYFNIKLYIENDTIKTYNNGALAVQIYSCREHREKRKISRFNDLISGSDYESYDDGGILYALNLKIKSIENEKYLCSFLTSIGEGSIFRDSNGALIISTKKRKDGYVIVDKIYNSGRNEIQVNFSKYPKYFKDLYRTGNIYFENEIAFNYFQDIFKKIQ